MLKRLPNECVLWRCVGDLCDQDACVITHLKPPRLIHPSLLLVSSSHGGRSSGEIRYSSSSFWRRLSVSTNSSNSSGMYRMPVFVERSGCCLSLSERMWLTYMKYVPVESGEAQTIEQVWEEYFADPLQWWDNRVDKVSLGLSLGLPVSWC
jgi:hypothetical protein